ncbi:unnamed protein product, partial [Polarella glacialis]
MAYNVEVERSDPIVGSWMHQVSHHEAPSPSPPSLDGAKLLRGELRLAEERIRHFEARAAELCAEGRETAAYCSVISARFDKQVELNATLQRRLQHSEATSQNLLAEVNELQRGEAERAEKVAAKEASVRAWRDERLQELPLLKEKLLEE